MQSSILKRVLNHCFGSPNVKNVDTATKEGGMLGLLHFKLVLHAPSLVLKHFVFFSSRQTFIAKSKHGKEWYNLQINVCNRYYVCNTYYVSSHFNMQIWTYADMNYELQINVWSIALYMRNTYPLTSAFRGLVQSIERSTSVILKHQNFDTNSDTVAKMIIQK